MKRGCHKLLVLSKIQFKIYSLLHLVDSCSLRFGKCLTKTNILIKMSIIITQVLSMQMHSLDTLIVTIYESSYLNLN